MGWARGETRNRKGSRGGAEFSQQDFPAIFYDDVAVVAATADDDDDGGDAEAMMENDDAGLLSDRLPVTLDTLAVHGGLLVQGAGER